MTSDEIKKIAGQERLVVMLRAAEAAERAEKKGKGETAEVPE